MPDYKVIYDDGTYKVLRVEQGGGVSYRVLGLDGNDADNNGTVKNTGNVTLPCALVCGIFQALSVFPSIKQEGR